tara:strand:- start:61241 stop:63373 length:2133 start_codon:yes stop_codon:yes gene_type:complete
MIVQRVLSFDQDSALFVGPWNRRQSIGMHGGNSCVSLQRSRSIAYGLATCTIVFALVVGGSPKFAMAQKSLSMSIGTVSDFSLPTPEGDSVSLDPNARFHVLCFLGCQCPLAKLYGPRLQALANRFEGDGVRFIGINSNVQDSMDEVREYAQKHSLSFAMAKDFDRSVAVQIGATRTPQVFLIDRSRRVIYQGRIDDQYQPGIARTSASTHDLRDAIEKAVAGETISNPVTEAVGCLISLPRSRSPGQGDVTYCDQVARILSSHCVECHREGEIGPFALDKYDEVVGWADMMIEVIDQQRMPPWHADPEHGSFLNARHMPTSDKEILRSWVDDGMPYGQASDLPEKVTSIAGWRLPTTPDVVFPMSDRPFAVPESGVVEYQYFVIDPGFKQDRWVRAVQVVPGNNAVVHHCIAFTRPPDGAEISEFGMLAAYVPGQIDSPLPPGYAQRVAAGTKIVLQMHYTPTGKPEQDLTRIGLVFADPSEVTHEVYAIGGVERDFEIPPHAADYSVHGDVDGFPKDGILLSIIPHMHVRGRSFQLTVHSDQQSTKLLSIPHYDFNWQHNYRLADPLPLSDVDRFSFQATFDNSADNPTNPDPTEYVTWGDQTWQEMAVVFMSVARPVESMQTKQNRSQRAHHPPSETAKRESQRAAVDAFATDYMKKFDGNGDGSITRHELPDSVRMFAFKSLDRNGNGAISIDEIRWHAARQRLAP